MLDFGLEYRHFFRVPQLLVRYCVCQLSVGTPELAPRKWTFWAKDWFEVYRVIGRPVQTIWKTEHRHTKVFLAQKTGIDSGPIFWLLFTKFYLLLSTHTHSSISGAGLATTANCPGSAQMFLDLVRLPRKGKSKLVRSPTLLALTMTAIFRDNRDRIRILSLACQRCSASQRDTNPPSHVLALKPAHCGSNH